MSGVVLPIDGDPTVAAAYSAWNANPCDTKAANTVTKKITALVSGIRTGTISGVAAHPQLANVVLVGSDGIIPMARLDDTTRVGNETGYASELDPSSTEYGALASSTFLSDDPYGDLDPIAWGTAIVTLFVVSALANLMPARRASVVDPSSAQLLNGATLDYKDGLQSGFAITNPNAERTCGCGQSFS